MAGICNRICSGSPLANLAAAIDSPSSPVSNIVTIRNQDEPIPPKKGLQLIPHNSLDSSPSPKNSGRVLGHPMREISESYEFGKELGRGHFGVTFLVTHKATKQKFACKSIPTHKLFLKEDIEEIRREVQIMHHLTDHRNIVELKDTYEDEDSIYLVMELCEGGELFDRIIARGHYSEKDAASLFRQIMTAIHDCHTMGVMHRDLKPENFLFLSTKEDSPLKATDFGLSVFLKPGDVFRNLVGSAYYVAPEVLKRQYGAAADVWSAGVILYILLCGSPPFRAKNERGIFREILKGRFEFKSATWKSVSSSAKDLIKRMLKYNPDERASVVEVLTHPWMREEGEAPDVPLDITVTKRMKQFSAMNKFKKVALKVIAENVSEEEIMGMKEMFKSMDADGSGTISFEELKSGIAKLGSIMSEADMRKLLEAADMDGDGTIDYNEFISATMHINRVDKEDRLFKAFEYFDKDKSGYICKVELEDALKKHSIEDVKWIEDILSEVDLNKDGKINYDEFVTMMKRGNSNYNLC